MDYCPEILEKYCVVLVYSIIITSSFYFSYFYLFVLFYGNERFCPFSIVYRVPPIIEAETRHFIAVFCKFSAI